MVNEWINEGIHPITGIKEYARVSLSQSTANIKHEYDYKLDVKLPDYA